MEYALELSLTLFLLSGFATGDISMDSLQYVGCFELSYALSKNYHEHLPVINLEGCVESCETMGSPRYVGIESSDNFCYCGGDIAEESVKRDDNLCNIPCSDVGNSTCGGEWLMSLYDTHTHLPGSDHNINVSFLIGISTGIRVYNSTRLPEFDTVMVTGNAWAYTVDYHYAKKLVFTNTKGKLLTVAVSPSFGLLKSTPSLVRELSQCDGFAVDWVADKIYWVDCTSRRPPNIMKMNLDGSGNEMVKSLGGVARVVKRVEIDPYNGMLCWLADGVIETLNLTSKEYHTNVSGEGIVVRALALERSTQKVYYVGVINQNSQLFSMDYTGESHLKIFSLLQMQSVFGLGIHGGFIYWINYAMSTDIIYKAPLHMEGGQEVEMIQTVNKPVWHMRVIHPDIQNIPAKNPCAKKRCATFCRPLTSTTAVCQCSAGYQLFLDERSCVPTGYPMFSQAMTTTTPPLPTTEESTRDIRYGNATYVGCFGTSYAYDEGKKYKIHFISLDKCISRCVLDSSRYAGIGLRDMNCYCGNDLATSSSMTGDSLCSERCPGTSGELSCGGDFVMSLYDISKMLPTAPDSNDEDSVNILLGLSNSVNMYNTTSVTYTRQRINTPSSKWAYAVDYHFSKNIMFMSSREALYKAPLFNRDPLITTFSEVMPMGGCEGFAVDWVFDRIFWANCAESGIFISVVDLNGGNPTPIGNNLGDGIIKRMEVDPYNGFLFWVRDNVIESCDTSGENFQFNVTATSLAVRGISLDIYHKRLFYVGHKQNNAELISIDYEGNDPITHLKMPELRNVYGLGIVRGFAYWVNYRSVDILYKAPLGIPSSTFKQLKVFGTGYAVWHMRVVDPELQSPPPLKIPSCIGGRSCEAQIVAKAHSKVPEAALIVVFVVVAGVLLAGLLMFLTDMKYWNILRARIPYSRENGRDTDGTSTYVTTEDTVNLI